MHSDSKKCRSLVLCYLLPMISTVRSLFTKRHLMKKYLKNAEIIDWNHPEILSKAKELSANKSSMVDVAKSCFEWVRDNIKHIGDYNIETVSCSASEVLISGSGICYAKSHLLAALLRANKIPAGFCYQRFSLNDNGVFLARRSFSLRNVLVVIGSRIRKYRIRSSVTECYNQ